MTANRAHVLKLRLSDAELESVRARAQGEPVAAWLRRLALDGAPLPRRRRRPTERPVSPVAADLTRAVVLTGNHLQRLIIVLVERDLTAAELAPILLSIDNELRSVLKAAQC